MNNFIPMLLFGLKRRSKDFFIIIYNLILPIVLTCALGYLMSPSYTNVITSYQYYAIVLIPFFISLAASTALYNSKEDKMHNVAERIISAPVKNFNIVISKIISSSIVLILITLLFVLCANFIFSMNLNSLILPIILLYSSFIFFINSIGYFCGFVCKNEEAIRNYMNLPMCLFAFMGGSFFPVGSLNPVIDYAFKISPIYWINKASFSIIYNDDSSYLYYLSIIMIFLGILISIASVRKFKKEVFI